MRNKILMVLCVALCMGLCACGEGAGGPGNSQSEQENTGNQGNEGNGTANTEKPGNEQQEQGYIFTYGDISISVNDEITEVIAKLGEPLAYFEAPSCAFEGVDKFYTYPSFQLDTYPQDGKDMLASIYFKDDLVTTTEGISLFMTKTDMINTYGTPTSESGTEYIYEKGNGCLRFIVDGEEIISIEYRTKVDYN